MLSLEPGGIHILSHFKVHHWDGFTEDGFQGSEKFSSESEVHYLSNGQIHGLGKSGLGTGGLQIQGCPGGTPGGGGGICSIMAPPALLGPLPDTRHTLKRQQSSCGLTLYNHIPPIRGQLIPGNVIL